MIRMVGQDAQRTIELLCQQDTNHSVRQGEARQRERKIASRQHIGGKPVGAAYEEGEIASVLHAAVEPIGKLARAHLLAMLIERHGALIGTQGGHELARLRLDGPRPAGQRPRKAIEAEARRLMTALRPDECAVTLDEHGKQMSTRELADWLDSRMQDGRDLAFLIGGPDGFAPDVLARSDFSLSLSRLTLPHAMVRVLLAEQLYRALSILTHHPYHRD